jgi:hypothetical protein
MSDLLNSASLVMIPSGYKEDTVFSAIPTDGSGDLSFTRASNGTRVNSAGLVEVCPWNLLQQSETFDNAFWTKVDCTVTANSTTAPNGTSTADSLLDNTSNFIHALTPALSKATTEITYTHSVYAKFKDTDRKIQLSLDDAVSGGVDSGVFNLSTGVWDTALGTPSAAFTNPSRNFENVGNGWYRVSLTVTSNASSQIRPNIFVINGSNASLYIGNGTGIYIWGAQLNIGATAKPYFPTTDRLNVPRLTYQNGGGGCPSLLLEKQSTNLVRNWNFAATIWDKNSITIVSNSGPSPDGTNNAFLIYPTSSGSDRFLYDDQGSASYTANADYTTTVYAKASGLNFAYIRFENKSNANSYVYFNLATGTVGSTTGSVTIISKTIESIGNGWYRLRVTANMGTGSGGANNVLFGVADADGSTQATTSGTNGVLFYGPQSEQSSYPTSPIQTSGASATRVADACFKTGISSLIGQTEGVVFFDFTVDTISAQTNNPVLWYMKDGGAGERYFELYSNGNLEYVEFDGTTVIASIIKTGLTVGRHKCAIGYANNDMVLYVDGVRIGTDVSGTPNGFSTFSLQYYNTVFNGQQKVNQCAIFKTRLTNAELASLTTI